LKLRSFVCFAHASRVRRPAILAGSSPFSATFSPSASRLGAHLHEAIYDRVETELDGAGITSPPRCDPNRLDHQMARIFGYPPEGGAGRLGHSSISITMDIYSQLMPNMQNEGAMAVDGALRAAIKKPDDLG
jgi:hypothetical protein